MNWRGKSQKVQEMRTDFGWPERLLTEKELRARSSGFVAISEQARGCTSLFLRQRGALCDGWGRVYPDHTLNWATYGSAWRAYSIPSPRFQTTIKGGIQ